MTRGEVGLPELVEPVQGVRLGAVGRAADPLELQRRVSKRLGIDLSDVQTSDPLERADRQVDQSAQRRRAVVGPVGEELVVIEHLFDTLLDPCDNKTL